MNSKHSCPAHCRVLIAVTCASVFSGIAWANDEERAAIDSVLLWQSKKLQEQSAELDKRKAVLDELSKKVGGQGQSDFTIIPFAHAAEKQDEKTRTARITSIVRAEADSIAKKTEAEKQKKLETEGYVVGSSTGMTASWNNGLRLQSANKDFQMHVGGRLNFDTFWFDQPANLRGPAPGGNLGVLNPGSTGVGPLDDGFAFRRIRLSLDGTVYELFEFAAETQFENLTTVSWVDLYGGLKEVPFLGTVRFGQMKVPQGLESCSTGKGLDFLERSALFETFWQLVGVGAFASNTLFDEHFTWAAMIHRIETFAPNTGSQFSDGDYGFTARISALPLFENDGRCLVHLGLSHQWKNAQLDRTTNLPGTPLATVPLVDDARRIVRYRTRTEIRDGVGTQGNTGRFVDTGNIIADDVNTTGFEFLWANGPVYVQAEATTALVGNATYPAAANGTPRGNTLFWGAYAQVGWFLTGEQRAYDKRFGRYQGNLKPNENFFMIRDESGQLHRGLGAWELAYRYSYVDLNDADSGILGGTLGEHNFALNWYWNPNTKIQFNYLIADRDVPTPAQSGTIQGFGIRAHYDF